MTFLPFLASLGIASMFTLLVLIGSIALTEWRTLWAKRELRKLDKREARQEKCLQEMAEAYAAGCEPAFRYWHHKFIQEGPPERPVIGEMTWPTHE